MITFVRFGIEAIYRNNKAVSSDQLFVGIVKQHVPVSKQTLFARWVKTVLPRSGTDTSACKLWPAHSTRGASCSAAAKEEVLLKTICGQQAGLIFQEADQQNVQSEHNGWILNHKKPEMQRWAVIKFSFSVSGFCGLAFWAVNMWATILTFL